MPKTFRQALLEVLEGPPKLSLKTIATQAGVSYEQLKKVKQRETASTNVDDAIKVANHFGLTLDEFLDDEMAEDRSRVVAEYMKLKPEERDFLRRLSVEPPETEPQDSQ